MPGLLETLDVRPAKAYLRSMNRRHFLTLLATGGMATLAGTFTWMRGARANPYYDGPVSDHFDGRTFFNPDGVEPRGLKDLLRWRFGGSRAEWPVRFDPPHPAARPDKRVSGDAIRVTMVGHATLLIQVAGLNILTDPVWSERASPLSFAGPKRVNAPGIAFEDLPPVDLVLLTHNHYDHLDVDTLTRLHRVHAPKLITPLGNDAIVGAAVPGMAITTGDWGDSLEAGPVRIHFEPCHHWSARGMTDRRMALWAAFVIETPAGLIYHIGDTGFHEGRNYEAAAKKYGGFRLANLPIGAYEPRYFMKNEHQDPVEAVSGFELCNAAHACGHHFGTFQLTDEGRDAPVKLLKSALADAGIAEDRFRPLEPGEAFDVPETD